MKGVVYVDGAASFALWPAAMRGLAPVANRPLAARAVDLLREAGVDEVAVVASAEHLPTVRDEFERARVPGVEWISVRGPQGLDRAMLAAADFLRNGRFVAYEAGGLCFHGRADLASAMRESTADALLVVRRSPRPEGVVPVGLLAGGPLLLEALRTGRIRGSGEGLLEALEVLEASGGRISSAVAEGWWEHGGGFDDLLEGNRLALDELPPSPGEFGTRNTIQGRVAIDPTAKVQNAVLRGPALVGPGAEVSDAFVGPYTTVGPSARVSNAEVEDSILLRESQILNVSTRLESSLLGPGAVVTRGFELPRSLRVIVGEDGRVELA